MATAGPHEERPQAGPLPSKRGEIGYHEEVHEAPQQAEGGESQHDVDSPPARHPADTPLPPTTSPNAGSESSASNDPVSTGNGAAATDAPRAPSPSSASVNSTSKLASFLHCTRVHTIYGLRVTTLFFFLLQLAVLGGTITGWVILILRMQTSQNTSSPQSGSSSTGQSQSGGLPMNSALIFVYIAFAVMTVVQIVFLERCTFRLRAERYAHLHPGEILPSHRPRAGGRRPAPNIAFAPWNRPPLPTYAAALAQSGVGTGDVEDNAIAIAPPPAYGERHASTLLLAGDLPERLRRVRESAMSGVSVISWAEIPIRDTGDDAMAVGRASRPVSYRSYDSEWEEVLDADAAARLEERLAKLEEGKSEERDVTDGAREYEQRR
ncbi:hypothetical protein WOLCODRAFT_136542 [Wolfiporia cocos MD-104 SS10]|uniref:Uncharacterized protein n=1 Tax=Wolfiporia cocos (strain MD-104) TaxID=742152 RepID=A0A2H3JJ39_WOLCO|nr:hypothetical protein WOLCODRAFT_136542 [Wolfiporia cocos MD-104 SS10]